MDLSEKLEDGQLSLPECYLHFIQSLMLIFTPTIKFLQSDTVTVADIFPALFQLRSEQEDRRNCAFFGFRVNNNLHNLFRTEQSKLEKQKDWTYIIELLNIMDKTGSCFPNFRFMEDKCILTS